MIKAAIFLFITALVLALLEIEIEGKQGWAARLPAWKTKKGIGRVFFLSCLF